jgi:hypothetical protein
MPRSCQAVGMFNLPNRKSCARRVTRSASAGIIAAVAAAAGISYLGGCASMMDYAIVACPLTYSEQVKELLVIVPKGTKRDEVLRRLAKAGVEGNFGSSRRIYYCDLWNRSNGEKWHMNVALLFDDSGKLYNTQVADSEVTAVPAHAEAAEKAKDAPDQAKP